MAFTPVLAPGRNIGIRIGVLGDRRRWICAKQKRPGTHSGGSALQGVVAGVVAGTLLRDIGRARSPTGAVVS